FAQALERAHDAPDRAKQTDVRAHRADVGEEFQVALEQADLAGHGDLHGALGALDHDARIVCLPLPLAGKFAEPGLEDGLDAVATVLAAAAAHLAEQLRQVAAGPESLLEALGRLQRHLRLRVL